TVVSDAALTVCIQELRRVLREDARRPRYLETVHRRGYRFIAPLATTQPVQSSKFKVTSSKSALAPNPQHPAPTVVEQLPEPSWSYTASTAIAKPSIALLPFVSNSG